jgi:hypothetical protein
MEAQHHTVTESKRALAAPSKSKIARNLTEGRKAKTCYSSGGHRSPVPPRHMEAHHFILHLLEGESRLS